MFEDNIGVSKCVTSFDFHFSKKITSILKLRNFNNYHRPFMKFNKII